MKQCTTWRSLVFGMVASQMLCLMEPPTTCSHGLTVGQSASGSFPLNLLLWAGTSEADPSWLPEWLSLLLHDVALLGHGLAHCQSRRLICGAFQASLGVPWRSWYARPRTAICHRIWLETYRSANPAARGLLVCYSTADTASRSCDMAVGPGFWCLGPS